MLTFCKYNLKQDLSKPILISPFRQNFSTDIGTMILTRNLRYLSIFLSFTLYQYYYSPLVTSFVLTSQSIVEPRKSLSSTPFPTHLFSSEQPTPSQNDNYNDDAFGLVFLGGAFYANDVIFAGIFLILSAAAAIATRQGKLPACNQVPAAVAGLTLLLHTPILTPEIVELLPKSIPPSNSSASMIELALCSISMIYGFVFVSKAED